jgi:hypothetical protein
MGARWSLGCKGTTGGSNRARLGVACDSDAAHRHSSTSRATTARFARMGDGSQTRVDIEKQGKGNPEGPGSVPEGRPPRRSRRDRNQETCSRLNLSEVPRVLASVAQHWSQGTRAMPAKRHLCLSRETMAEERPKPLGPLTPGLGKDHATPGQVTDLGCLCTPGDDDFRPVTHSPLALAPHPSVFLLSSSFPAINP